MSSVAGSGGVRVTTAASVARRDAWLRRLPLLPAFVYVVLVTQIPFALTIWYAWSRENYFTIPFLILFVLGYWYTGLMSLLQGRFESLMGRANLDESSPKPFPVGV